VNDTLKAQDLNPSRNLGIFQLNIATKKITPITHDYSVGYSYPTYIGDNNVTGDETLLVSKTVTVDEIPQQYKTSDVLLDEYDSYPIDVKEGMNARQKAILSKLQHHIDDVGTPSARLEDDLHLPVALVVIPLFALANAGIAVDFSSIGETLMTSVSLGIIAGLVLGKVLGIFGVAWLAIKLNIASLPQGSSMNQIFGVAFLGGIGFTMSIFVADLAFVGNPELIFQAKVGILAASLFAGLFGYTWLRLVAKSQ